MKIRGYSFLFFVVMLILTLTVLPPHFRGAVTEPGAQPEETPLLTSEIQANAESEVVVDCTPLIFSNEYTYNVSKTPTEYVNENGRESTENTTDTTDSAPVTETPDDSQSDIPGGYPESHLFNDSGTQTSNTQAPADLNSISSLPAPTIEEIFPTSFLNESPMIQKSTGSTFLPVSVREKLDIIPCESGINGRSIYGLREHYIEEGDTLEKIAARYLGDENRYMEIYEQNNDVLPAPDELPIGAILRIPDRFCTPISERTQ
ncbi:MAG: LysM peptidoglycan-binding domain-containing protein [Planctomycetia bacterium]|nr:LysM peptidoglycan-binding domain-containing protein [Planctomycetia bacterium]